MDAPTPASLDLDDEERRRLELWASAIRARGVVEPARFLLESTAPLHFLASQSLIALRPLLGLSDPILRVFGPWDGRDWQRLAILLEKRDAVPFLLRELDRLDLPGAAP